MADETRRAILATIARSPRTTGEIVASHPAMTRTGVMKHLNILTDAGLVRVERRGRERWNFLNPEPLRQVCLPWLKQYAEQTAASVQALKELAESRERDSRTKEHARNKQRKATP